MKKLLLFASLMAFALQSDAQFKMKNDATHIAKNSKLKAIHKPEGNVEDVSVFLTVTKNSGTGGAKCYLQVSDDGIGWTILNDSLTINSSTTYPVAKKWDLGPKRFYFYQTVIATDTFTQDLSGSSTMHYQGKPGH